jgi:formyltetrahydrofolate hydrolase
MNPYAKLHHCLQDLIAESENKKRNIKVNVVTNHGLDRSGSSALIVQHAR